MVEKNHSLTNSMRHVKYLYIISTVAFLFSSVLIQALPAQKRASEIKPSWPEICPPFSRFHRDGGPRVMTTPLLQAIVNGNFVEVARLVANGADVNEADKDGTTPLLLASGYADAEMIKVLIKAGSKINVSSQNGFTPLMLAARCSAAVKILIESGAIVDSRNGSKETALMRAAQGGNLASVKHLTVAKADISEKNGELTPLMFAIKGGNPRVVDFLLKAGAKKELVTDLGSATALNLAAANPDGEITRILLGAGANSNASGKYGATPLTAAAMNGNIDAVRLLIAAGADPNFKVSNTLSPIACASTGGYTDVVKELIKAGANVYNKDDWWPTLITAARNERIETMDVLLKAGADINMRSYDGRTAIMYAAGEGKIYSVRFLIEKGADLNIRKDNQTALTMVIKSTQLMGESKKAEIVKMLRDAGAIE
ncbi:MAG: ankyrin repeat domain-containing protein [Acidobacteriota bacterium]